MARRLLRATDEIDAIAVVLLMPGPTLSWQVLRRMRSPGVTLQAIERVDAALDDFQQLIRFRARHRVTF